MNRKGLFRRPQANAGWTEIWADLVSEIKKKLVPALVGAAVGMGGLISFWLSPLKEIVMHTIWQESADLTIITPAELHVGEPVQVLVEVMPPSSIPVSGGFLTISSSDTGFVVKNGISTRTTPEIATPTILLKDDPLVLQAAVPGRYTITAKLKTKLGNEFTAQTNVLVRPINQPTKENLSGQWRVRIGHDLGTMELIHRGAEVSGIYTVAQPQIRGNVAGFADGATVNADLVNQGETRRKWLVRALYNQTGGFVEIKGEITRQIMENNDWTPAGKPEEFYATSDPKN